MLTEQIDFVDNLSKKEKKFLVDYASYENKSNTEIDLLFNRVPKTKKEFIVYRGTAMRSINPYKTYVSTSLNKSVARNFMDFNECCLYRIIIPKGSSVLPLFSISEFKEEKEVLLKRGSRFRIIGNCTISIYNEEIKCIDLLLTN